MWNSLLVLALLLSSTGAGDLVNGDFESGSKQSYRGWVAIWPRSNKPAPEFRFVRDEVRSGKQCAQIRTQYKKGYTSFTQELRIPKGARYARLSGWIQLLDSEGGGSASLHLSFAGSKAEDSRINRTKRVAVKGDWTHVEVSASVPEGMSKCLIRCGVLGSALASFDDIELEWIKGKKNVLVGRLGFHDTFHDINALDENAWLQFSVPLPFAGQTPLAIELSSTPPGRIVGAEVVAERENRLLRVYLAPEAKQEKIRVAARTYVLFDEQELDDGAKIKLGKLKSLPEDVRQHLQPAPGIESDDARIAKIAKSFSRRDLKTITRDMLDFLGKSLGGKGGGSQGALASLERGEAVCTGHANLGAALMIAAKVPTRILACVVVGGQNQEHYVIETWTPKLGWARVETTTGQFPLRSSEHLILRVIYPDTERNKIFAPIHMEASPGSSVRPGFGALEEKTCWQAGEELSSFFVDARGLEHVREMASEAYDSLNVKFAGTSLIRLAPASNSSGLSDRIELVLKTLEDHLEN